MIGQFAYAAEETDEHVVLDMQWQGSYASARVLAPEWVLEVLAGTGTKPRSQDEVVGLPMALSYGVLIASLSGALLTLSGDRSVWPDEWGRLIQHRPSAQIIAISH